MNNLIKPSILITLLITLVSCGGGGSSPSVISAPSAPSNLTAAADNESQITLNWTSASGATYYEIHRHTSDDSTAAAKINSPLSSAGTSFENTGLTINTTYYYWLKACHDTGCSDFSSVASADTSSSVASAPTTKDWSTASHIQTLTASSSIMSAVFSPDGTKIVAVSYNGAIIIWNGSNYNELTTIASGPVNNTNADAHKTRVDSVAFSPDGTKLVSGSYDKTIKIWDVDNISASNTDKDKPLQTIASSANNPDGHSGSVGSLAFSPDGSKLVSGSYEPYDKTIKIWDVSDNYNLLATIAASNPTNQDGHGSGVNSAVFSPDGTKIVSGSDDATIKIWDAKDSYSLIKTIENVPFNFEKNPNRFYSVAFSPDGSKIVSGSADNTIKIWDVDDNYKLVKTFEKYDTNTNPDGHSDRVNSVVFNHDGTKIVSGSSDRTIKIWDVDNGYSLVKTFEAYDVNTNPSGHSGFIQSVAFSPDGSKIVSGSYNKTIKIWE